MPRDDRARDVKSDKNGASAQIPRLSSTARPTRRRSASCSSSWSSCRSGSSTRGCGSSSSSRAATQRARAARSSASPSPSTRASCASSRCPRRPSGRRRSGTSSATSRTCRPPARWSSSIAAWYNRAGVERVLGFTTEEEVAGVLPRSARVRAHADPLGGHPHQVLVQRQRRGAGAALPGAHRATRSSAGSSARWTSSRATTGRSTRAPRTRCSPTPTPSGRRGTWSRATTRSVRASTASATCSTMILLRDVLPKPFKLPPRRPPSKGYVRPPLSEQTFVPQVVLEQGRPRRR